MQKSTSDAGRVPLLWKLGEHYLTRPDEHKQDLDSAFYFVQHALQLCETLQDMPARYYSIGLLGRIFFESGQQEQGKACFREVAAYYHGLGNSQEEMTWLRYLAIFLPEMDSNYPEKVRIHGEVLAISRQVKDTLRQEEALKEIADVYLRWGKLDTAELKLLELLRMQQAVRSRKLLYTYDLLAAVSTYQGNYNKALPYAMETIRQMQLVKDTAHAGIFYNRIGSIYGELGHHERSTYWHSRAFTTEKARHTHSRYVVCGHLVRSLIWQGKQQEALLLLRKAVKEDPPQSMVDKGAVARALGDCYKALHRYTLAERYYLEMMHWEEQMGKGNISYSQEVYYSIGKFYTDRRQYDKAGYYLRKLLTLPAGKNSAINRKRDTHLALFKVDSASGSYLSAIRHLQLYNLLRDSIFTETKSRQLAELQVRYETSRKEQDIQLLRNRSQLERSRLQQARLGRNLTLAGIIMLLAIVGLLYNRYRLKQRSHRQLQAQQEEIHRKNYSLEALVKEKDRLLEEKQWLLKEVHHRVKNNLQIVMSLLNTQSAHTENDAALLVIRENQHRVYAMSLIHQKLYQSENVALIDMPVYIRELVDYLRSSFDTRHIRFELRIAAVKLDVSQTVPLGLILNEAVTNAIKYAFPGERDGCITVTLRHAADGHLLLAIADNGIGLPADFDPGKSNSLGMSLMQGLSRQLGGSFQMRQDAGLAIAVQFMATSAIINEMIPYE
ncbi:hypothetical protein GCM10009415_40470 [Chitinophaga japonensis]